MMKMNVSYPSGRKLIQLWGHGGIKRENTNNLCIRDNGKFSCNIVYFNRALWRVG